MTKEYNARSRVPSQEYKDSWERIFGKKPAKPAPKAKK